MRRMSVVHAKLRKSFVISCPSSFFKRFLSALARPRVGDSRKQTGTAKRAPSQDKRWGIRKRPKPEGQHQPVEKVPKKFTRKCKGRPPPGAEGRLEYTQERARLTPSEKPLSRLYKKHCYISQKKKVHIRINNSKISLLVPKPLPPRRRYLQPYCLWYKTEFRAQLR